MNKLKKWVYIPLGILVGGLALIILLTVLGTKIGFLWALLIESVLVAVVAFIVASKFGQQVGQKITNGTIIVLVCVWGIVGMANVGAWLIGSGSNNAPAQNTGTISPATNEDKAVARKKLDEYLSLAGKSGLVSSYEFSDKARVIYVGNVWYTQKVAFKKDFLGAVALQLKTITGYHNFEVLDAYSNEKVAEVTAFGGSLEVYK